jgi:hypothetical protein
MVRLDPRSLTTEPTMETLTDIEKQALTEILEDYIDNLRRLNCNEAAINHHIEIATKLGLTLFDYYDWTNP